MASNSEQKPAFPKSLGATPDGLTKREWFAGQALIANAVLIASGRMDSSITPDAQAGDAYEVADAMLRERDRSQAAHPVEHGFTSSVPGTGEDWRTDGRE